MQRRKFLKKIAEVSSLAMATSAVANQAISDEANESKLAVEKSATPRKIVIGIMGMQRGIALAKEFAKQENVELRYLCDVDSRRLQKASASLNAIDKVRFENTKNISDFRHILDDPEVDALVCSAPNHWHGPATILACNAGKHVYVEKPASHNPAEGEWMVAAAKKHKRLVQVGMQRRSNSAWIDAIGRLHQGLIGEIFLGRAWYSNLRGTIGNDHFVDVPEHLDYELWQGPAPRKRYSNAVVHYNWHWRWHWGNGEIGNNGVHTLDLCRWGLKAHLPIETVSMGGRYAFEDAQETPDTNTANFKFENNRSATWECTSCNRHDHGFVTFYGSDGTLEIDADGGNRHFDRQGKLVTEKDGSPHSLRDHIANFLDCIRNEKDISALNADITIGHESALLCHLANISYRKKQILRTDPLTGRIIDNQEAMGLWQRDYAAEWKPVV